MTWRLPTTSATGLASCYVVTLWIRSGWRCLERPAHPYTQLAEDRFPSQPPRNPKCWAKHIELGTTEVKEYGRIGCKFAGRCPHVMDICREANPPDVQVGQQTVKCYLYRDTSRKRRLENNLDLHFLGDLQDWRLFRSSFCSCCAVVRLRINSYRQNSFIMKVP